MSHDSCSNVMLAGYSSRLGRIVARRLLNLRKERAKAREREETFSALDDRNKRGHLDLGLSSRAGQSSSFF